MAGGSLVTWQARYQVTWGPGVLAAVAGDYLVMFHLLCYDVTQYIGIEEKLFCYRLDMIVAN